MSIFKERIQRDDMYSLAIEGFRIDKNLIEGKRIGKLDGPHLFFDSGEVLPSSLLKARNNRRIDYFKSTTFRLGLTHSHDSSRQFHIIEVVPNRPTTIASRFKKRVKEFRNLRKANRDR
jgi:hypothetical protein